MIITKPCQHKDDDLLPFQLKRVDLEEVAATKASSSSSSLRGSSGRGKPRSPIIGFEAIKRPPKSASPVQDPSEKVIELNRRLAFVKSEHQDILRGLHAEIEELKRKNKGEPLSLSQQFQSSEARFKNRPTL